MVRVVLQNSLCIHISNSGVIKIIFEWILRRKELKLSKVKSLWNCKGFIKYKVILWLVQKEEFHETVEELQPKVPGHYIKDE